MKQNIPIFGISGKIGSGKTTLAELLIAKVPGFVRCSYGDFLKREVAEKFNFPLEWCYSQQGKNKIVSFPGLPSDKMTVRSLLQWWGTDIRRELDRDYWVKQMDKYLFTVSNTNISGVIIDDVRFVSEAELVRNRGGILIRLNTYDGWSVEDDIASHRSEIDLDDYKSFHMSFTPDFGRLHAIADDIINNLDQLIVDEGA